MAEEMVTVDWSNEEELLKEEAEEEKKAEEAAKSKDEKNSGEETSGEEKEKKDGEEAMDTSAENKEQAEEKKEQEAEKTLITSILKAPVKITNVQIKDLLSRELQQVLHKSTNTQIDITNKKGTIHLNFTPRVDRYAVDVLRKLARFQFANKEVKIQCSRSLAALLGYELRKLGVGPAPQGTLQFDKVLFLYDIPAETTEEVLRAMFDCPICIIPLDEEGNNFGCAILEFRSKKAAKQCYNDNQDVEIGDVKVTLHNKYQHNGRKEEEEEERAEREKKKREADRKSNAGQQKKNQNQNRRGGIGKPTNRSQAVKQKFNNARQMGAFGNRSGSAGGGMGFGGGNRLGMQGGRMGMGMGGGGMDQGVSPNLMMNQMMAMMRMSQGEGMGRGMGMGNRMGGGMAGMGRMGSAGMGGFDDYSGDYGFDDYESGYNQGGNRMGGRRVQQNMMGNQRRGSFGSGPSEQKDSVVDLFESALDAVDSKMGGINNRLRSLSEGVSRSAKAGSQNRPKLEPKRNNANRRGRQNSGKNRGDAAINRSPQRPFGTPGNKASNKPVSILDLGDMRRGRDTGYQQSDIEIYGDTRSSSFGQEADRTYGTNTNRFKQEPEDRYSEMGYSRFEEDNRFGSERSDMYGRSEISRLPVKQESIQRDDYGRNDFYNSSSTDDYGARYNDGGSYSDRSNFSQGRSDLDQSGYGTGRSSLDQKPFDDMYGRSSDLYGGNQDNYDMGAEAIGYPDIYSSKGSSGLTEMYGYDDSYNKKAPKRTFTEEPLKRTFADRGFGGNQQDDFVFKKPMMAPLGSKLGQKQGNRGGQGQQQGNKNKGRGGQKNQGGRGGRNQQAGRQGFF